jgi:hypothetical protein
MFLESILPSVDSVSVLLPEDEAAKRPPNAFILFCRTIQPSLRAENPDLSDIEIYRLIGKMWQLAEDSMRGFYREQAKTLSDAYRASHPEYDAEKRKKPLPTSATKAPEPIRLKVVFVDDEMLEHLKGKKPSQRSEIYQ